MEAVERGWLPDPFIRYGIRRLLRQKLDLERHGGPTAMAGRRAGLLRSMEEAPLALHAEDANRQHYELPPEFFQIVLGPRLKYSCAWWEPGTADLGHAEADMLALTAKRARLADGQRILELGCGWGSLTLWMAEHLPNAQILAVSNSAAQRQFILNRAAERGYTQVEVVTADMNDFALTQRFDRVVSVEMFEHMRNWALLLERITSWLAPEGELFVHHFCHRDLLYFYELDGRDDWMARHFFTGGMMPALDLLGSLEGLLRVEEQWAVNGVHYEKTCRAWLTRQDACRDRILPLFEAVYGRDAARWFERWRLFFLACAELFAYAGGTEWLVGHYRLISRGE